MSGAERPKRQVAVEKTKLILVEGVDEQRFFEALLGHLGIVDVQILPVGGKSGFGATLSAIRIDERFEDILSILLVRDADWAKPQGTNAGAAWEALVGALAGAGLPQPTEHAVLRRAAAGPGTAVYVMPDGAADGMLEDLCLRAMQDDGALPCLDAYFACLKEAGFAHAAKDVAKARAHALLASRKDPDLRVGEAAKRGYFPFAADTFKPLIELLRAL